jgi:hypothetical protein
MMIVMPSNRSSTYCYLPVAKTYGKMVSLISIEKNISIF